MPWAKSRLQVFTREQHFDDVIPGQPDDLWSALRILVPLSLALVGLVLTLPVLLGLWGIADTVTPTLKPTKLAEVDLTPSMTASPQLPSLEPTEQTSTSTPVAVDTPAMPPTLTPLATVTPPTVATPMITSNVVIAEVHLRTNNSLPLNDEYVVLLNFGPDVDLSGWILMDEESHAFTFKNIVLLNETGLKIHTGRGEDTDGDLYWGQDMSVWNQDGDIAVLKDGNGILIDQFSY